MIPHIMPTIKNRIRKNLYIVLIFIAVLLLYRLFNENELKLRSNKNMLENEKTSTMLIISSKPVIVDIYMESQCPDTTRFFHQQLKKTWELLGKSNQIELTLIPFGKARCIEKENDFQCQCQHGIVECEINQLMNCVIDRFGFSRKYIHLVICMQGKHTFDEAMNCVSEAMTDEVNRMRVCAKGQRGRQLLALAGQRTASLLPVMDFVPWIVINGKRNSDALYDLTQNVCEAMNPKISLCEEYLASLL